MRIFKNSFGPFNYRTYYITDTSDALKVVARLEKSIGSLWGLDIETAKLEKWKEHKQAGLDPHLSQIRLLQIYDSKESVFVFDLWHVEIEVLRDLLEKGRFCGHYSIFEISHLSHAGFPDINIGCSMILSQILYAAEHSPQERPDPEDEEYEEDNKTGLARYRNVRHGLADVSGRLFGIRPSKLEQKSNWNAPVLTTSQIIYAGLDSVLCYHAAKILSKKLKEYKMERCYKLLKDTQHIVAGMHLHGLPVDWEYHQKLMQKWEKETEKAKKECLPFFGAINTGSAKQMSFWLSENASKFKIDIRSYPLTKKGKVILQEYIEELGEVRGKEKFYTTPHAYYAFGKSDIGNYEDLPPIKALLNYKTWAKLTSTYGKSLVSAKHPVTGNIHSSYTLADTRTGRMSSRKPNAQNYPSDPEFRNMFCAPKGYSLVVADFSQIEIRVQGELSQDPVILSVYKESRDIYCELASFIFGRKITKEHEDERYFGKQAKLSLSYGMGAPKFERNCRNQGIKKYTSNFYKMAHKKHKELYSVYSGWCDGIRRRTTRLGYTETMLGKRRKLEPDEIYTRAPNTCVQGSSAEMLMDAMLICQERLDGKGRIVAAVHDEILIVCPAKYTDKAKTILAESMNQAMKNMFPKAVSFDVAKAGFGERWGDIKVGL